MALVIHRGNRKRSRRKSSHSEAENRSFCAHLTDELVVEILIRLPCEAACRCKLVCKRWYTLFSDGNYFITRFIQHRDLSQSINPFSLVLQTCRAGESLVQLISPQDSFLCKMYLGVSVDMRFIPCVQQPVTSQLPPDGPLVFQLESSCADFLFSYNNPLTSQVVYHICNVVTKQWADLPPIPRDSLWAEVGFLCDPLPWFQRNEGKTEVEFSAHYKYRVVRVLMDICMCTARVYDELIIQIFSSEKGRWTKSVVRLPRTIISFYGRRRMIAFNRTLRLIAFNGIIDIDPFHEIQQVFRIIDLPVFYSLGSGICLGTSQGQLRLSLRYEEWCLDIWDLEDCSSGKWCLAYRFSNEDLVVLSWSNHYPCFGCEVLDFHPYDRNILYLTIDGDILQCDLQQ